MIDWQPIETAQPKLDQVVLVLVQNGAPVTAYRTRRGWRESMTGFALYGAVTHWSPINAPEN